MITGVPSLADLGLVGVKQTLFGRGPEHNEPAGNCMQAALATALGARLGDVPHFLHEWPDDWWPRMNRWLLEHHGLQLVGVSAGTWTPPEAVHLAVGTTVRSSRHVVVAFAGRCIFDPHPSDAGLSEVDSYELFIAARPSMTPALGRVPEGVCNARQHAAQ